MTLSGPTLRPQSPPALEGIVSTQTPKGWIRCLLAARGKRMGSSRAHGRDSRGRKPSGPAHSAIYTSASRD
ncbi:unnamed protein product [Periconia digitata]|uniref:Uncharacterized protein n=1 Tax=Periconia digitata TaxID=1303443 RepID=A0A9W4XSI7_9PLEO|nr:unnamed protein product [Periconia digitata]